MHMRTWRERCGEFEAEGVALESWAVGPLRRLRALWHGVLDVYICVCARVCVCVCVCVYYI